ncbi:citrate/2-methylcitrate synthase [Streptomyces caniscabiei]|uniref:citrate/2-methylcitrate synthase n=1 Tax=Streptomyces caniscabiei TaxID=2746961 RepID=UPI0029B57EA7|nr:citrate/2-methylcitrate synthase [Streptomyces caniscabiei]MDX2776419.1 citrate/2-methylcitrate synthase [Streptomyces caniscabiei]
MIDIAKLRSDMSKTIILGSHPGIIQSILDYDFLCKRQVPSVVAIIANGRKQERYFWGDMEIAIPVIGSVDQLKQSTKEDCTALLNVQSARRVLTSTKEAVECLPNVRAVTIFAEQTPEAHTLELAEYLKEKAILVAGPSSVGLLLPGYLKLGAIGGTQHKQLIDADILDAGDIAVISTSGGIVNELIHTVTKAGHHISFALALGGDRFPLTTPASAMLLAEADSQTKRIVYFGELGGEDEYEIAKLIKEKKLTKEIVAYIAGTVAELFENPPQFGHAKALAQTQDESASAKKAMLRENGVIVCDTFGGIANELKLRDPKKIKDATKPPAIGVRQKSLITSRISGDKHRDVQLLGNDLLATVTDNSSASLILSMLLGKQVRSEKAEAFTDYVFRLLVDHGPYVSGALNTIVTARAGKDLVSSLVAGLLTIGPRFGGAINAAAEGWLNGVSARLAPREFVELPRSNGIIAGIGHKKYRLDLPDPRVKALMQFANNKNGDRYLAFALEIEKVTTTKKANLILNVDGVIAAILLDILESELEYDTEQLKELVDIEFFNALFVLSRSVGFTAHYLDQRRYDEGLLRLPDEMVTYFDELS